MQAEGVASDSVSLICGLKACGTIGLAESGQKIHVQALMKGFDGDLFMGSALVDMYAKCGSLSEAKVVFSGLQVQSAVAWTALIAGYVDYGYAKEALNCFEQMQKKGCSHDMITLVCILKACGSIHAIEKAFEIHNDTVKEALETHMFLGSALVDMYMKFGLPLEAQGVFDKLHPQNLVAWNSLIAGYGENGMAEEVFVCFEKLQWNGVPMDAVTYLSSLKGCRTLPMGQRVHLEAVKEGLEKDSRIGSALVDMYARCGSLVEARELFDELSVRITASWTALIAGYTDQGLNVESMNLINELQRQTLSLDIAAFVSCLKTCGIFGLIEKIHEFHAGIAKQGIEKDPSVGNTLVDVYLKCSAFPEAHAVFLPHDVVSWTALISGYTEFGLSKEALECLDEMEAEGIHPSAVTLVCSLKACGNIGAIKIGRELHKNVSEEGFEGDFSVGNTLVDMYAKCGLLMEAWEVFDELPVRDVVSWNVLMAGCACQGDHERVVQLLERMSAEGKCPNELTFLSVLTACSHAGLLAEGQYFFENIIKEYGSIWSIEHHNCMIDLFSRAGQCGKAARFVENMILQPNLVTWRTMLGACQKWGNVNLGEQAFQSAIKLDDNQTSLFILTSNLYVNDCMWGDLKEINLLQERVVRCGALNKINTTIK